MSSADFCEHCGRHPVECGCDPDASLSPRFDPDFGRTGFARRLFRLRFRTLKIPQTEFANKFGIALGVVKDIEQGKRRPSRATVLVIAAIERDAKLMAEIAEQERAEISQRQSAGHRWSKSNC